MNSYPILVKPWLEELLDADYKVLIYNGQLDIIIANTLTTNMVDNLNWKGKEAFEKVIFLCITVGWSVGWFVYLPVCPKAGWKLHFHTPIGALVFFSGITEAVEDRI